MGILRERATGDKVKTYHQLGPFLRAYEKNKHLVKACSGSLSFVVPDGIELFESRSGTLDLDWKLATQIITLLLDGEKDQRLMEKIQSLKKERTARG